MSFVKPPPDMGWRWAHNGRDGEHVSTPGDDWTTVNMRYNKSAPSVEPPKLRSVLVVGAGPSVERLKPYMFGAFDAVFLTIPVVEQLAYERDNTYIVDAEIDPFIPHWYYFPIMKDRLCIWTRDKYVERNWPVRGAIWFDRPPAPRSSGVLAIYAARKFGATDLNLIGMDLTGPYKIFREETDREISRFEKVTVL